MGASWRDGLTMSVVWRESGFAKTPALELGFAGYLGAYQEVSGTSGAPGTRKVYACQRNARDQGTITCVTWLEPTCRQRRNGPKGEWENEVWDRL